MPMYWSQALRDQIIARNMLSSLIIVGETADGLPFCYEDRFKLVEATEHQLTLRLEYGRTNPLEKLSRVQFIEYSFRNSGILYYACTELLHHAVQGNACVLTLAAPDKLQQHQNRRFERIILQEKVPVECRIVGIRRTLLREGARFQGDLLEISGGGLSFITSFRLLYPLFIRISFQPAGLGAPFDMLAEVMRVTPFGSDSYRVAAEFRSTPEDQLARMADYCASQHIIVE
jgi:hypothetical protein